MLFLSIITLHVGVFSVGWMVNFLFVFLFAVVIGYISGAFVWNLHFSFHDTWQGVHGSSARSRVSWLGAGGGEGRVEGRARKTVGGGHWRGGCGVAMDGGLEGGWGGMGSVVADAPFPLSCS